MTYLQIQALKRLNIARAELKYTCPGLYYSYLHFHINQRAKRINLRP